MQKHFNIFIVVGIIFTLLLGTLLHFVYDWSGSNSITGLFSPINESVWEHLKLLFYPMSLWIIGGYFKYGKTNPNYIFASLTGLISGLILIPALFYAYTSIIGTHNMTIDILIYIISTCISFLVFRYILFNYNIRFFTLKAGIFMWELIFVLFVIFTMFPPSLPLFTEYK